mmetsp:Transcript_18529/g.48321  ORF Transcript_18529/g.48321 Transcript_18529/m.48321 type:complete len:481 (-) Transcript_18529:995-2437(-)
MSASTSRNKDRRHSYSRLLAAWPAVSNPGGACCCSFACSAPGSSSLALLAACTPLWPSNTQNSAQRCSDDRKGISQYTTSSHPVSVRLCSVPTRWCTAMLKPRPTCCSCVGCSPTLPDTLMEGLRKRGVPCRLPGLLLGRLLGWLMQLPDAAAAAAAAGVAASPCSLARAASNWSSAASVGSLSPDSPIFAAMPAAAVAAAVAASTAAPASPCGFPPASLTAPPSLANPLSLGIAPSVVLTKPLLSAATAACAAQPSASPPLLEALLAPLPKMLREEPSYAPQPRGPVLNILLGIRPLFVLASALANMTGGPPFVPSTLPLMLALALLLVLQGRVGSTLEGGGKGPAGEHVTRALVASPNSTMSPSVRGQASPTLRYSLPMAIPFRLVPFRLPTSVSIQQPSSSLYCMTACLPDTSWSLVKDKVQSGRRPMRSSCSVLDVLTTCPAATPVSTSSCRLGRSEPCILAMSLLAASPPLHSSA